MTDLLVSGYTPTLGTGRALRTYTLARALSAHGPLDFLYVVFGARQPSEEFAAIPHLRLFPVRASRGVRRGLAYARARADGVPRAFARGISPELATASARLAAAPGRDRIIADGPTTAAALRGLACRRPVIYNSHNIESSLRATLPGERRDFGSTERLVSFERRLLETFAETWVVSDADLAEAVALAPRATLRYVPNAVDVKAIRPVVPSRAHRILFSGDFTYEPNRNALAFLLDAVMPLVWQRDPDARLVVTGRSLSLPSSVDRRVEGLGFVSDLDRVYSTVDCVVVPLAQSGGSPLKFVEALAHGLPVVATSTAARGLNVVPGRHFIAAHDAPEFAAAVVRVLFEGEPAVAAAGRQLAEQEYSIEALIPLVAA